MLLEAAIFNVLMTFTPWRGDTETLEERQARMHVIASAIDSVTERAACEGQWDTNDCKLIWRDRVSLAARLAYLADAETNLAHHVHAGMCGQHDKSPRGECDSLRARSLWQLHFNRSFTAEEWAAVNTIEGTEVAAWKAARQLAFGRSTCDTEAGMFSFYGHGNTWACDIKRTKNFEKWTKRADGARRTEVLLRKELALLDAALTDRT